MADGMNKAILIGNLGKDPELTFTKSQQAVLKLRLATNESWKDKEGNRQERTEWHQIVVWGKRAEGLSKILAKGAQLGIEGRISTREYQDKDGNKRWTTEIVATEVYLLGGKRREEGDAASSGAAPAGDYDDSIPF